MGASFGTGEAAAYAITAVSALTFMKKDVYLKPNGHTKGFNAINGKHPVDIAK